MRSSDNRPVDPTASRGEPAGGLTPEDLALIDRIAVRVVETRMTVPAILFVEMNRPLSFVGSQFLHFLEPIVRAFVRGDQYTRFARLMEDRSNLERLVVAIETHQAEADDARRARTKEKKP